MKKRMIALTLCIALLAALLLCVPGEADNKLSFISINDTLPPELINTAVTYGGRIYVPCWLFSNYSLGLTYVYFSSASTAYLSNAERQLFFEMPSGKTYDGDDFHYSIPAILQGGTVYLPLSFVCSFFGGIRYSTIADNEYGTILRITNGAEVLTDAEFQRYSKNAMRSYYQNYNKAAATPDPTPAASPVRTPPPISHEGDQVRLALLGLPEKSMLEQLQRMKMNACFFLTADEIRADPDLVRCLACTGYGLGLSCPDGTQQEFDNAAALLTEAARLRSSLIWAPEAQSAPVGAALLRCDNVLANAENPQAAAYALTALLETGSGSVTLALSCSPDYADADAVVLNYLYSNGFSVAAPRLTDAEQS